MPTFATELEVLEEVRDRLDGWLYRARERAFSELFEGEDALLTEEELRLLDELDSRLSREQGRGLWDADDYGIVPTGTIDEESTPRVVCTTHPQLPADGYPGEETLDATTKKKLNDALWEYSQRVVELTQQELEEFVWSADVETWGE
ncbi:hypothetical protein CV102_22075 [Natronococcus pandeyae]|uniref:Uncharacterized protein n=1 Tax=Natronococcus pandeyae TaxID=2055836 RepID=A0A8J8Q160_9EURY|nr:hypothetical protein [Natronococcus pandeyae]TYL36513.1 hypothetical protein CV102_22075 [Natronococcus pandeyae]